MHWQIRRSKRSMNYDTCLKNTPGLYALRCWQPWLGKEGMLQIVQYCLNFGWRVDDDADGTAELNSVNLLQHQSIGSPKAVAPYADIALITVLL